jgi:hypothetical protein
MSRILDFRGRMGHAGDPSKLEGVMRRFLMVLMLLPFADAAMAESQIPRTGAGGRGRFGAPVVRYTTIRDQGAAMFGGRGGWNVAPSLLLGGGLYGTLTEVDAPEGALPDTLGALDIKFEIFGFDLEYAAHPAAPTHLTLTAFFGGAAAHYVRDGTDEQYGETDFMLLLEPAVGVERRVTDWLHLNFGVSYRLVGGVEQPELENGDFNGAGVALAVKFGRF